VLRDLRRGEVSCLKRLKRLEILEDVGYEKGRGKKILHSRGGRTPFIVYSNHKASHVLACCLTKRNKH